MGKKKRKGKYLVAKTGNPKGKKIRRRRRRRRFGSLDPNSVLLFSVSDGDGNIETELDDSCAESEEEEEEEEEERVNKKKKKRRGSK